MQRVLRPVQQGAQLSRTDQMARLQAEDQPGSTPAQPQDLVFVQLCARRYHADDLLPFFCG